MHTRFVYMPLASWLVGWGLTGLGWPELEWLVSTLSLGSLRQVSLSVFSWYWQNSVKGNGSVQAFLKVSNINFAGVRLAQSSHIGQAQRSKCARVSSKAMDTDGMKKGGCWCYPPTRVIRTVLGPQQALGKCLLHNRMKFNYL